MNNIKPKLKRDMKVHILVADNVPYRIIDKATGQTVGTTLKDGLGVYLHNVNFKVIDGQPTIEGCFKGFLEELRLNLSEGKGIIFDKEKNAFTDGKNVVRTARMVQVYNGVIKVVID